MVWGILPLGHAQSQNRPSRGWATFGRCWPIDTSGLAAHSIVLA